MTFWEWLDTARGEVAVAGIAGAAVSAVMEWEGLIPSTRRFFVGFVTAFFLGPVGIPLLAWLFPKINVPVEHAASVGGFVIGVSGIILIEIFLSVLKLKKLTLVLKDDTKTNL